MEGIPHLHLPDESAGREGDRLAHQPKLACDSSDALQFYAWGCPSEPGINTGEAVNDNDIAAAAVPSTDICRNAPFQTEEGALVTSASNSRNYS